MLWAAKCHPFAGLREQMAAMALTEQECFSCAFSPYTDRLLCCATSQYFGIAGNGSVMVFSREEGSGVLTCACRFDTQDGSFDAAWSEAAAHQLVSVSGDGSVYLWDRRAADLRPLRRWQEHGAEAVAVRWNCVDKAVFVTASWDGTARVWTPARQESLCALAAHRGHVFDAAWSAQAATRCATVGADRCLAVWDTRSPGKPPVHLQAHDCDVLACDWSKYSDFLLATGAADGGVGVWDLRQASGPVARLAGHKFSVRRLRWDPHSADALWSAGYDMNVLAWRLSNAGRDPVARFDHHREFAVGLDLSVFTPGLVASCGWDRTLHVWRGGDGEEPVRAPR